MIVPFDNHFDVIGLKSSATNAATISLYYNSLHTLKHNVKQFIISILVSKTLVTCTSRDPKTFLTLI